MPVKRRSKRIAACALVVGTSPIGGNGLYARQNIPTGTIICHYKGDLITREKACEFTSEDSSHFCVLPGTGMVINGEHLCAGGMYPRGGGCMQVANHGRGHTANAKRRDAIAGRTDGTNGVSALGQVQLVATKAIRAGDEVRFDYGRVYWKKRRIVPL